MKKFWLFLTVAAVILGGCFSPWNGNEAVLTLQIGGGYSGAREAVSEETLNNLLRFKIILTRPGDTITFGKEGPGSLKITAAPGTWEIKVDAYNGNDRVASGAATVNLKSGPNNTVRITMVKIGVYTVEFWINDEHYADYDIDGVKYGKLITPPVDSGVERWYTDAACDTAWDFEKDRVTSNMILYARSDGGDGAGITIDIVFVIDDNGIEYSATPDTQTIYRDGGANRPGRITFTITGDYDSVEWSLYGIIGTDESFTVDAMNDIFADNTGVYLLTVEVNRGTAYYSKTIEFEVE